MSNPKVSVCIPAYNAGPYIVKTIQSVLNQSFTDFEIVVLENASTDNTREVLKTITDPRVKVFHNDTLLTVMPNWNKVLTLATGDYVKLLPADDILYVDCLKEQVAVLDKDTDKSIGLLCSTRDIIDDDDKVLFNRGFSKREMEMNGIKAINKVIKSGGNTLGEGGAILFRREVLDKTGLFIDDIEYVMDLDLWLRILLHGNLYNVPHSQSGFRVHRGSGSVNTIKKHKYHYYYFIKKLYRKKEYGLSWMSARIGIVNSFALNIAKRIFYRFILN